jgi:uncharacterized protein (DUF1778 family)
MKKKVGRPKKTEKEQRGNTLRIRLTASERHTIDDAAGQKHLDTSAWVRSVILTEAEKIVDK